MPRGLDQLMGHLNLISFVHFYVSDLLSTTGLLISSLALNLLANSINGKLSALSESSRSCLTRFDTLFEGTFMSVSDSELELDSNA